jgi:tetratricopeptide (TPR) repeat protein
MTACSTEPAAEDTAGAATALPQLPVTTASAEARADYLSGLEANDVGRLVEAHEHMLAAVAADPDFAMGHLGAAFTANSLEAFSSHLQMAVDHAAGASEAEQAMIASFQKGFARDYEGQLAEAQRLAQLAPDAPRAWLQVAAAQSALGRFEDERATAMKIVALDPTFVPAYARLGNSYLFSEPRDFSKAEEMMNEIVELEPNEPNAYDLLGDVHRAQGNLEAARADYTHAAELDPTSGSALQQRGHVNSFLGNYDEARADYQASMDLSDAETAANFAVYKALVSIHAGDPKAAIAELEQQVTDIAAMEVEGARSLKINALSNIWTIAVDQGMADVATSAFERMRELMMAQADEVGTEEFRRGQEATLAYFEGMMAAHAGQTELATSKADEYMSLVEADTDPNKNRPAHEVMGLAALMNKDYDEAVAQYEQTDPADIYARYHLGLAYEGAGNAEAAQAIFDDVAKHNFNFAGYALIRKDVLARASAS